MGVIVDQHTSYRRAAVTDYSRSEVLNSLRPYTQYSIRMHDEQSERQAHKDAIKLGVRAGYDHPEVAQTGRFCPEQYGRAPEEASPDLLLNLPPCVARVVDQNNFSINIVK